MGLSKCDDNERELSRWLAEFGQGIPECHALLVKLYVPLDGLNATDDGDGEQSRL